KIRRKFVAENKTRDKKLPVLPRKIRERRQNARRVFLDPSTPPVLSIARVVIITLLILAVFEFVRSILSSLKYLFFMIILAVFFAYLLEPLVKLIRRPFRERGTEKWMPRSLAIVIAYLLVFTVLGVAIAALAPQITNQVKEFAQQLPTYADSIQEGVNGLNQRLDRLRISEGVQKQINERIGGFLSGLGTYLTTLIGLLAIDALTYLPWLILVPILAFFFLKDVNFFRISLLRIIPSGPWRMRLESVLSDVNTTLAAYTRAQLISCVLISVVCTIAFYVLGVNYALLLGILAGVLEFIPLIGPLTLAFIATTIALLQSPWLALWTAIFLVILRLTHDYVTYPRIVREGIHLHPLAVILSILAGEQVAGIPGVFLSIPIVALLTVLYKHILEHSGSKGFFAGWLEKEEEAEAEV
ncbi:MAG TPA: AI-2E family transporter, partial [Pyrinomonadaceae bacterium]|nr:AI-2E family transporter [Pyrinomonadaceae bacterium]